MLFPSNEDQDAVRGRDGLLRHPPWSVPVTFFETDLIAVDATGVLSLGSLLLVLQMVWTGFENISTWRQLLSSRAPSCLC